MHVRQNHEEELCTAWIVSLPPSERKSPVVTRIKKPAQQWILEKATAMKEEIARVSSERHVLTMTIEDKKKAASKAKNAEDRAKLLTEVS